MLRACGEVDGLERVRFTSPHPRDFTDDVIAAMAETPNVMPQLHMPLQSGSDSVLRAMKRSYRQKKYLGIIDRVRAAIPDAAITTDIIVGFPGETESDFEQTLDVVRSARFAGAFTFQYSTRPGTPAATMENQVPKGGGLGEVPASGDAGRGRRLAREQAQVGRTVDLLVAEGEGRKDDATGRLSGRAPDNRLVHFRVDDLPDDQVPRPGDMVTTRITFAAPFHLVADGSVSRVRRTRAGDAWQAREGQLPAGEVPRDGTVHGPDSQVLLGMPTLSSKPVPAHPAPAHPVPYTQCPHTQCRRSPPTSPCWSPPRFCRTHP